MSSDHNTRSFRRFQDPNIARRFSWRLVPPGEYATEDLAMKILVLCYLCASPVLLAQTSPPSTENVVGVVRNAADRRPVADAIVVILPDKRDHNKIRGARSDQDGRFMIENAAA